MGQQLSPSYLSQRGRFFLARLAWRAGRPRSQRRACWERERLARMVAEMPCSATPRAGTPAKKTYPFKLLPPPYTGEELPSRARGGLGWGLCLNLTAKTLTLPYLPR